MFPEGYLGFLNQRWCGCVHLGVDGGFWFRLGWPHFTTRVRLRSKSRGDSYRESKEEFVKIGDSLISVVDDDESVRESLPDLLREFGFTARAFSSAEEFLSSDCVSQTQCLILDISMPGMSGPDLQQELTHRQQGIPIIFITAPSNAAVRLRLLRQGAVECLFKPFTDSALLDALNAALAKS